MKPAAMHPNLPPGQRATQRLVDAFNEDERRWHDLRERLRRLAERVIHPRRTERTVDGGMDGKDGE